MLRDSLPEDLKPYEADLFRVVSEGLALFNQRFHLLRAGMSVRTERNNIHDCMVEAAKKVFGPSQCRRRGQLFLLALGDYRIKLKKFDERLVTSSYRTQAVFDFLAQAVRTLFDIGTINLQLGYIPTGLSVGRSPVWITKPTPGGKPEWEYEFLPAGSIAVTPLPITDPHVPPKRRVSAKPAKFKKGQEGKKE